MIVKEEKTIIKCKVLKKFSDLEIFLLENFLVNVDFSDFISKCGILLGASGFSRVLIVKLRHV